MRSARLTVIPEARSDVSVTIVKNDPRHPLRVNTGPDGRTVVDGGYRHGFFGGVLNCNTVAGRPNVVVGRRRRDRLRQHGPGGGSRADGRQGRRRRRRFSGPLAGRTTSIFMPRAVATGPSPMSAAASPCPMRALADIHAGTAGMIQVSAAGSGDVFTHAVGGGVEAAIAGVKRCPDRRGLGAGEGADQRQRRPQHRWRSRLPASQPPSRGRATSPFMGPPTP